MADELTDELKISFTSDLWTDQYKQISYLTITAHWINSEWELVSSVLCTQEFDATKKKTGDNINIREHLAQLSEETKRQRGGGYWMNSTRNPFHRLTVMRSPCTRPVRWKNMKGYCSGGRTTNSSTRTGETSKKCPVRSSV